MRMRCARSPAPRHRPMIRQQNRHAVREKRLDGIAQRGRSGHRVRDQRHGAQQQDELGQHVRRKRLAGHRIRRGHRRVRMHHRAAVGPAAVHPQMQI